MYETDSRDDLSGRRTGELGQLCLALATHLRQNPYSSSTRILSEGLSKTSNGLRVALMCLKNHSELESIITVLLTGLTKALRDWLEERVSPGEAAEKIQRYGASFYGGCWGLGVPPRNLSDVAEELRKLRDTVRSYGPEHRLAVGHASWIAAMISKLFDPDRSYLCDDVLSMIRERTLATISFLDGIASRNRSECCVFLDETARFLDAAEASRVEKLGLLATEYLCGYSPDQDDSEDLFEYSPDEEESEDLCGHSLAQEESCESDKSMKNRFVFGDGVVLFDGRDLDLPSGEPINILKLLVDGFGSVVKYTTFDPHYCSAMPGSLPKSVSIVRTALRRHQIPCEVKSKRGEGYLIRASQGSRAGKKRVRKR